MFLSMQTRFLAQWGMETQKAVGGAWLVARYGIVLVMPLAVQSRIGGRRTSLLADGIQTETLWKACGPVQIYVVT